MPAAMQPQATGHGSRTCFARLVYRMGVPCHLHRIVQAIPAQLVVGRRAARRERPPDDGGERRRRKAPCIARMEEPVQSDAAQPGGVTQAFVSGRNQRIRLGVAQRIFSQRSNDHAFAADAKVNRISVPDRLHCLALPGEIGPRVRRGGGVSEHMALEPVIHSGATRAHGLLAVAAARDRAPECRSVELSDKWRSDVGWKLRSAEHHGQLHLAILSAG